MRAGFLSEDDVKTFKKRLDGSEREAALQELRQRAEEVLNHKTDYLFTRSWLDIEDIEWIAGFALGRSDLVELIFHSGSLEFGPLLHNELVRQFMTLPAMTLHEWVPFRRTLEDFGCGLGEFIKREERMESALVGGRREEQEEEQGVVVSLRFPFAEVAWFIHLKDKDTIVWYPKMGSFQEFPVPLRRTSTLNLNCVVHATHVSSLHGILQPDGMHFNGRLMRQYHSNRKYCWFAFPPSEPFIGHKLFERLDCSVYGPVVFRISSAFFSALNNYKVWKLGTRQYKTRGSGEICNTFVMTQSNVLLHDGERLVPPLPSQQFPPEIPYCNWQDGGYYEHYDVAVDSDNLVISYDFLETISVVNHRGSCVQFGRKATECSAAKHDPRKIFAFIKALLPPQYHGKLTLLAS
jgi:hypothetical protein